MAGNYRNPVDVAQTYFDSEAVVRNGVRRLRAIVQYDGTEFSGFQRQKDERTVQSVLESSLGEMLGHPVTVKASGRTDAGVHARGQVISFTTSNPIPASKLPIALSTFLPGDVLLNRAEEVDVDFDPQMDAVGKTYCYRIWRSAERDIFWSRYSHPFPWKLDFELIQAETAAIVGKHDFLSFRAEGSSAKTTIRTVTEARWVRHSVDSYIRSVRDVVTYAPKLREERESILDDIGAGLEFEGANDPPIQGEMWEFLISADGFLYRMVRLLVGTLLDVARGHLPPGTVAAALENSGRVRIGSCAPPAGLCLEKVKY